MYYVHAFIEFYLIFCIFAPNNTNEMEDPSNNTDALGNLLWRLAKAGELTKECLVGLMDLHSVGTADVFNIIMDMAFSKDEECSDPKRVFKSSLKIIQNTNKFLTEKKEEEEEKAAFVMKYEVESSLFIPTDNEDVQNLIRNLKEGDYTIQIPLDVLKKCTEPRIFENFMHVTFNNHNRILCQDFSLKISMPPVTCVFCLRSFLPSTNKSRQNNCIECLRKYTDYKFPWYKEANKQDTAQRDSGVSVLPEIDASVTGSKAKTLKKRKVGK